MLGYGLFLLVTTVMLVRPTDLHPMLYAVPLYELAIIPCILVSIGGVLDELSPAKLAESPLTVCILGLWASITVAALGNGLTEQAINFGVVEYGKVVLLYLLLISQVTTPARLKGLMVTIAGCSSIAATIAVLHYHGYISVETLRMLEIQHSTEIDMEAGTFKIVRRLCGTGVFNDPNDLCQNVAVAFTLGTALLLDRRSGIARLLWVVPLGFLGYTMLLTRSRGGMLCGVIGVGALIQSRLRSRKALIFSAVLAVAALGVVKGRQSSIDFQSGTGKSRMELWAESFPVLRASPLFGIGPNQFPKYAGHVAHNSFVEAYVDLGLLGGAFHFGAYYYVLLTLWRLGSKRNRPADPERQHLLICAFAVLTSYFMGEQSLTHPYNITSVLYLGVGAAAIRICQSVPPLSGTRLSPRWLLQFFVLGLLFYLTLVLFAKTNAQWG